jgi:hypothetical protein
MPFYIAARKRVKRQYDKKIPMCLKLAIVNVYRTTISHLLAKKDKSFKNVKNLVLYKKLFLIIFILFLSSGWHGERTLKGPKREIFGFWFFAQIRPIWIG